MVASTRKQKKKASSEVTEQVELVENNKDSPEEIQQHVEETKRSPLDEMVEQAQKAYVVYTEAEKQLAGTYREIEVGLNKDCEQAQQRAQNDFNEHISGATKEREETITRAVEAHRDALQIAEEALHKTKQEADNICQEKKVLTKTFVS